MKILDIHTHHHAPQPEGIISLRFAGESFEFVNSQYYSLGIHPWDSSKEFSSDEFDLFGKLAESDHILAIGEGGIDLSGKGAPLYRQMEYFRFQIEISERLHKPLVIHDVKSHDIIIGLRKEFKPLQNWMIHGFRGKPSVAEMLLRAGCYLSFGVKFNTETMRIMPEDKILAETDDSPEDIEEVIKKISEVREADMTEIIASNSLAFLGAN